MASEASSTVRHSSGPAPNPGCLRPPEGSLDTDNAGGRAPALRRSLPGPLALVVGLLLVGGLARPATATPVFTPASFPHLILALPWEATGATCTAAPPTTHNLPTATGSGTVTYTLDDDDDANTDLVLPDGLSFITAATPALTGTPTAVTPAKSYTLTATDGSGSEDLKFDLEVVSEKAILEKFYTATGGNGWTTKTNWGASISVCPGDLHGVTASDGRVSELILSANELTGRIPADLGKLIGLTKLHLPGNKLTGGIPNLGKLTSLQEIYLHKNALTSAPDLSSLSNLTHLGLSLNKLASPPTVSGLSSLVWLWLNNNALTSPPDLSGLSSLTHLHLSDNKLTSPPDVSGLSNLAWLDLQHNQLASAPDVSGLNSLTRFWLYGNPPGLDLTGQAPAVSLAATPNPVTEGGVVTLTATLSATLGSDVSIRVWLVEDTADILEDLSINQVLITLTIPAGETSASGDLKTVDDSHRESTESFWLALQVYPLHPYLQPYVFSPPNSVTPTKHSPRSCSRATQPR